MPDRSIPDANGGASSSRDPLLTSAHVAEYLGVPVGWVRDHSNGKRLPELPSLKLGKYRRFRMRDIESFLEKQSSRQKPTSPERVLPAQSIAVRQAKAAKKQKGARREQETRRNSRALVFVEAGARRIGSQRPVVETDRDSTNPLRQAEEVRRCGGLLRLAGRTGDRGARGFVASIEVNSFPPTVRSTATRKQGSGRERELLLHVRGGF
jgi:hypothetical protein